MKMNEVLTGLIAYIQVNYPDNDKDIRGIHIELVGVNPNSKEWNIGVMLPTGTQYFKVVQE